MGCEEITVIELLEKCDGNLGNLTDVYVVYDNSVISHIKVNGAECFLIEETPPYFDDIPNTKFRVTIYTMVELVPVETMRERVKASFLMELENADYNKLKDLIFENINKTN